jgi:hypothetical protein
MVNEQFKEYMAYFDLFFRFLVLAMNIVVKGTKSSDNES